VGTFEILSKINFFVTRFFLEGEIETVLFFLITRSGEVGVLRRAFVGVFIILDGIVVVVLLVDPNRLIILEYIGLIYIFIPLHQNKNTTTTQKIKYKSKVGNQCFIYKICITM
jgi:hypothetical protein